MRQRETAYQVSTTESETSPRMYMAMAALWLLRKADVKAARSEASALLHHIADAFDFTVAELLSPEM